MSLHLCIQEFDSELELLRRTEPTVIPAAHRDYVIGKKTMGITTDAGSIKRRCVALTKARARAWQMQYEPLTTSQLIAELAQLRRTIPEVATETIYGEWARIVCAN